MKRAAVLVMSLAVMAGSWQGAGAQAAAKPGKSNAASRPSSTRAAAATPPAQAPVETAEARPAEAESASDVTPVSDSAGGDSLPKKKGGLFGKAKGVMKNKVVQQVAKVAACTMVPGGQAIAGAIDAASSKSAGEAASGAAGMATGSSCMPGMGAPGMGAAGAAGTGMATGTALAGAAGAGIGGAPPGMPPGGGMYAPGLAGGAMPPGAYGTGGDPGPMADCLGLTVEEYAALTNPTNGEARQPTKAESKQMQKLSKRVGPQRQMACSQQVGMQQAGAQMAQMQQMMAPAQAGRATGPAGAGDAGPAACMGLTAEEYLDMTDPTHGEARSPTKDEMKRAQKLTKKVGPDRTLKCQGSGS